MQVVICFAAVFFATSDPSHAVVLDYHAKAVAWDQYMAQRRAGEALGWASQLEVAQQADMLGDRVVRLSLQDAQGQPLTDASVELTIFHHARANDTLDAELPEAAPGEYVSQLNMRRPGLWAFEVQVTRGEEVYRYRLDQQVGPTTGGPR